MKYLYKHMAMNSLQGLHVHSLIKNNDQVRTVFSLPPQWLMRTFYSEVLYRNSLEIPSELWSTYRKQHRSSNLEILKQTKRIIHSNLNTFHELWWKRNAFYIQSQVWYQCCLYPKVINSTSKNEPLLGTTVLKLLIFWELSSYLYLQRRLLRVLQAHNIRVLQLSVGNRSGLL